MSSSTMLLYTRNLLQRSSTVLLIATHFTDPRKDDSPCQARECHRRPTANIFYFVFIIAFLIENWTFLCFDGSPHFVVFVKHCTGKSTCLQFHYNIDCYVFKFVASAVSVGIHWTLIAVQLSVCIIINTYYSVFLLIDCVTRGQLCYIQAFECFDWIGGGSLVGLHAREHKNSSLYA